MVKRLSSRGVVAAAAVTGAAVLALGGTGPVFAAPSTHTGARAAAKVGYYPGYPKYKGTANLIWWTWVPNYQKEVSIFEKYYPNIHVKAENVGAGTPEYTKLSTTIAAKHGAPDVVMLEFGVLPQFIQTGGLMNIAKYTKSIKKAYPGWIWKLVTYSNGVYSVPEDTGPTGLFYSKQIFSKYHLAVPTTWSQFFSEAIAYHKKTGNIFTNFNENDGQWMQALIWQTGQQPFKQLGANKWKVNIDTPQTVHMFEQWGKMVKAGAATAYGDWTAPWEKDFAQGKFATIEGCAWFPSEALDEWIPKKDWSVYKWTAAFSPQWKAGGQVEGDWGGSSQAVTTQTKHPRAAAIFASFINTAAPELAHDVAPVEVGGGGLFPADRNGFKTASFKEGLPTLGGQAAYSQVFAKAQNRVAKTFQFSPWSAYFYNELSVEATKAISGSISWSTALRTVQQSVVQFAKQQGYQVVQ